MTVAIQLPLRRYPSRMAERREQAQQIARVRGRIGQAVLDFARERGEAAFGIEELQAFVRARCAVAPSSSDRILRDLRSRGELDYIVISRSRATYRFTRTPEVQQP